MSYNVEDKILSIAKDLENSYHKQQAKHDEWYVPRDIAYQFMGRAKNIHQKIIDGCTNPCICQAQFDRGNNPDCKCCND